MKPTTPPLRLVYRALFKAWGTQHWWPAETRIEMMIGAILTQNTAWTNVEKALVNLKRAGVLNIPALHAAPLDQLAAWIRPAGYFNVKAKRIKHFVAWVVDQHGGDIDRLFRGETETVRAALLGVHGIGKETADSMMLYAGDHPVFVVDAYTRRFLTRHHWIDPRATYDEIAAMFAQGLNVKPDRRVPLYNEFHALIVVLAKRHCRTRPDCAACPLKRWLPKPGRGRMTCHDFI